MRSQQRWRCNDPPEEKPTYLSLGKKTSLLQIHVLPSRSATTTSQIQSRTSIQISEFLLLKHRLQVGYRRLCQPRFLSPISTTEAPSKSRIFFRWIASHRAWVYLHLGRSTTHQWIASHRAWVKHHLGRFRTT